MRQTELDPQRFQEMLQAAASGEDYQGNYRVIVPGRILLEPEQLPPDEFAQMLAHPGVVRHLDQAVEEVQRGDVIPDEEMDEIFRG